LYLFFFNDVFFLLFYYVWNVLEHFFIQKLKIKQYVNFIYVQF